MTRHPGHHWLDLMDDMGTTQADVARAIGVSAKHLNQVVRGHALPSPALTVAFAGHLGVDAMALWHAVADYQLALVVPGRRR